MRGREVVSLMHFGEDEYMKDDKAFKFAATVNKIDDDKMDSFVLICK